MRLEKSVFKGGLLLSALCTCSFFLSVAFHEFGHASAKWLSGERIAGFDFQPFGVSVTYYANSTKYPAFTAGSGFLLGLLLPIVILVPASLQKRKWFFMPGVVLCAVSSLYNGVYILLDLLIAGEWLPLPGDASVMVQCGISERLLIGLGFILLVSAMVIMYMLFRKFFFPPLFPIHKRIVMAAIGIFPLTIWQGINNQWIQPPSVHWLGWSMPAMGVVLILLAIFSYFPKHYQHDPAILPSISWMEILYLALLAGITYFAELLITI